MGAPKKELDVTVFEELCKIQCTKFEICGVLHVSDKILDRMIKDVYKSTFSEVYEKYSADGKMSLRRAQFKLAERNPTMAIWLGKQYLGQREPKQEFSVGMTVEDFFKEHKLDIWRSKNI